jgi:uncharacterized membrane protein YtjA (UPF0391 family)
MLGLAILFLVVALIAGFLGFAGVMTISVELAQIFFIIFLILFVISFLLYFLRKMEVFVETSLNGRTNMLGWTVVFLVVALIAGLLGFTGIMSAAAGIAKILFVIFLILFVVSLILNMIRR